MHCRLTFDRYQHYVGLCINKLIVWIILDISSIIHLPCELVNQFRVFSATA
jgi:hypothetical protein